MNRNLWDVCWVALPLVLPLLMFVIPFSDDISVLTTLHSTLAMSLLFGGLQYVVMVVLLAVIYRHKDINFWHRLTYFLPIIYAPFAFGGYILFAYVLGHTSTNTLLMMAPFVGIVSLVLGYVYVLAYQLFTFSARRFKLLCD